MVSKDEAKEMGEMRMPEELHIKVVRDFAGIEEIREMWTAWQRHPNADLDFYLTVLRSRADIIRPHVIVLYRNNCPEAMLIGRIEKSRLEYKIGYKRLARIPVRQLTLIYGGGLGNLSAENSEVLFRGVMDALSANEADVALLNHVRIESPLYRFATTLPGLFGRDHFHSPIVHWGMSLPTNVEDLSRIIPSDTRRQVRRHTKFLNSDFAGQVRIEHLVDVSQMDKIIADIELVAQKTYQRALGVGFVSGAQRRQQLEMELQNGWLRVYLLYIADKPCAFWMGDVYHDVFYSGDVGYDPAFKKYGVGTMLLMTVLENLCNESVREADFGFGDAEWKRRIGNQSWQDVPVFVFAPTLKGLGLNVLFAPIVLVNKVTNRLLEKTGLLQRIKTAWRNRRRRDQSSEYSSPKKLADASH